jgi:oxygen-independent coproporphyrinogen-3 oxidase
MAFPVITREQLTQLDVQGPRYASYPAVADWSSAFGEGAHSRQISRAKEAGLDEPLSLYVHIPFCKQRCTFCGCNVVVAQDSARADEYLDHVIEEMELVSSQLGQRRTLSQFHWGGL